MMAHEILVKARAIIAREPWCSPVMSLMRAVPPSFWESPVMDDAAMSLTKAMRHGDTGPADSESIEGFGVYGFWLRHPHAEVLAAYDRAIEATKE
jgi:hypothetical protein